MNAANLFFILAMLSILGTLGVFLFGMVAMAKGGKDDHKTSNKMMQLRVLLQGSAIFFLFLAFLAK